MAKLKLKIAKSNRINPATKQMGYAARVITNGTADYDDIAEDAAEDTTFNVDEIRAAAGIFCRAAAKRLKQGFIVDLGPVGRLYPSCTSGWVEKEEDLLLSSVKPSLYYKPADEVEAAIKSASLVWARKEDEDGEAAPDGGTTTDPSNDNGGNSGGGNNGGNPSTGGSGQSTGGDNGDDNGGGGGNDPTPGGDE